MIWFRSNVFSLTYIQFIFIILTNHLELCDWLTLWDSMFDWQRAPSSKHQFEILPYPSKAQKSFQTDASKMVLSANHIASSRAPANHKASSKYQLQISPERKSRSSIRRIGTWIKKPVDYWSVWPRSGLLGRGRPSWTEEKSSGITWNWFQVIPSKEID